MAKKLMLLALSVAALAAFVVPASASADHYFHNGGAIPGGHIVETYSGTVQYTTHEPAPVIGVHCATSAVEVTIETESAQVISFAGLGCTGVDGFSECTVNTAGVPGLAIGLEAPWPISVASGSLEIENLFIFNEFEEGCQLGETSVPALFFEGTVTATPTVAGNLGQLTLSGTLNSPVGPFLTVSGTLTQQNPSTELTFE